MLRSRRSTRFFLGLLGIATLMVVLAALGGTVPPLIALVAALGFLGVAAVALLNIRLDSLSKVTTSLTAMQASPAAKKAAERARNRGGMVNEMTLMELGLLLNEKRRDGRWNRRIADRVSLDDGYIQPFANIHIHPGLGERIAIVQFDLTDQAGNVQFSHEMKQYVRDGENLITCERQMALRGNPELTRSGAWDLRITVDGNIVGVHNFSVTAAATLPPANAAGTSANQQSSAGRSRLNDPIDDEFEAPLSLEELLQEQRRNQGNRSK